MILNKITGLWMIISAFVPFVWILIFITLFFDLGYLINGTVNQINHTFVGVAGTFEQATSLNISVEPLDNLEATLSQVSQQINTVPVEIKIPEIKIPDTRLPVTLPSIPAFDIPVPGLKDVQNILAKNFVILSKFNQVIGDIPDVKQIQEYYQETTLGVQNLIKNIQIIAIKILALIVIGAFLITPALIKILIIPYIKWTNNRVKKGWKLIHDNS